MMKPTPEQIERWLERAKRDLQLSRKCIQEQMYDACAFFAQQAAEKYLKAAYMTVKQEEAPRVHSLPFLAAEVGATEEVMDAARRLTGEYTAIRYPDAATYRSHEDYDREVARERLRQAEAIIEWVGGLLE